MCNRCVSSSPALFPRKRESLLIAAQARTQTIGSFPFWIPACAGMTRRINPAGGGGLLYFYSAKNLSKNQTGNKVGWIYPGP